MTLAGPHVMRLLMTAFVFGIPEHEDARASRPTSAAASATKIFLYPEYGADGRSPRRSAGRSSGSRRGVRTTLPPPTAATTSPTSRSARATTATSPRSRSRRYANLGGVPLDDRAGHPDNALRAHALGGLQDPEHPLPGDRRLHEHGMVDAYRGAGRPEATYVIERPCDLVAARPALDPAEVRRRNFIPPEDFPYDTGVGQAAATTAATTSRARPRARDRRLRRLARRAGSGAAARRRSSGSASRPTSRSAASRRRRGSDGAARAGRRPLGERERPRPPHRQGGGDDRVAAARAGPRDDVRPGGLATSSACRSRT